MDEGKHESIIHAFQESIADRSKNAQKNAQCTV